MLHRIRSTVILLCIFLLSTPLSALIMFDRIQLLHESPREIEITEVALKEKMSVETLSTILERVVTSKNWEPGTIKFLIERICTLYVDEMARAIKAEIAINTALRNIAANRNGKHTPEDLEFLRELKHSNNDWVIPPITSTLRRKLLKYLNERLYQLVTTVSQPVIRNNDICRLLSPALYEDDIAQRIESKLPLCDASIKVLY